MSNWTFTAALELTDDDKKWLNKRFVIGNKIRCVMVKHAQKCLNRIVRDPEYQMYMRIYAKKKKFTNQEKKRLSELRMKYGLSKYQFEKYLLVQKKKYEHLMTGHTVQAIADDVWTGVEKILFGNGEKLHYKKRTDFRTMRGKSNETGILYRNGYAVWMKRKFKVKFNRRNDQYVKYFLGNDITIKLCRIVRKWHKTKWKYCIQMVLDGIPPVRQKTYGTGKVGLDLGVSTIAAVSDSKVVLKELGEGVSSIERELRVLQRKSDRQRRANNPENYNSNGTVRSGHKKWKKSKGMLKTEAKIRELYRLRREKLKQSHIKDANLILSMGDEIYVEEMNIKAMQRRSKKTGKKRFGKSIQNHAPSKLIGIIDQKLHYTGREVHKVKTKELKASQYNHITGEYMSSDLNKRWKHLDEGEDVQRDLYSAFLLQHVSDSLDSYDQQTLDNDYSNFKTRHDELINSLRCQSGRKFPSCMGI